LEEAVERKRVAMGALTVQGLREAVMEGALLRLRPKIMTVSTVVAVFCRSCGLRAPEHK
jgi:copper/silver efflux system protein